MTTIQIVLEDSLLRDADRAARRRKVNRSALIREALRLHLQRQAVADREARDRRGYEVRPQSQDGLEGWDEVAAWPER